MPATGIVNRPPACTAPLPTLLAAFATAPALVRRGCDEPTARLATDAGVAVMRLASRRALAGEYADFTQALAASAADLLTVATEAAPMVEVRGAGHDWSSMAKGPPEDEGQ